MKSNSKIIFLVKCIIALIIMLSPTIITGNLFVDIQTLPPRDVAEIIIRTLALIIGLLVLYDSIKTTFSSTNN